MANSTMLNTMRFLRGYKMNEDYIKALFAELEEAADYCINEYMTVKISDFYDVDLYSIMEM